MQIAAIIEGAKALMNDYPGVAKALEVGGAPVCKALEDVGAGEVCVLSGRVTVSDGTEIDPVTAWALFQASVHNLTKTAMCQHRAKNPTLCQLGEPISNHLVAEYYKRYPRWPAPNSAQMATIPVHTSFQAADNLHLVFALTTGSVAVCDVRKGQRYEASLDGRLKLDAVTVVRDVMSTIEHAVQQLGVEQFVAKCERNYSAARLTDALGKLANLLE
jgi:hypothetical protein